MAKKEKIVRVPFYFPYKGLDKSVAASKQPMLTSYSMLNVRPQDVADNRVRGGQRPGLKKWGEGTQAGSTQPIVALCVIGTLE